MIDITPLEQEIPAAPVGLATLMCPHLATEVVTSMEVETQVLQERLATQAVVEPVTNLTKMEIGGLLLTIVAAIRQRIETITTILLVRQTIIIQAQEIGEIGIGRETVSTQIKGMIKTIDQAEVSTINLGIATMAVVALI